MRKWMIALLFGLALTLAMGAALADGPTDPYWAENQRELEYKNAGVYAQSGDVSVTVRIVTTPTLTTPGDFDVVFNTGDPADYEIKFGISDEGRDPTGYLYSGTRGSATALDDISFYSTGDYSIFVFVYEKSTGNQVAFDIEYFSLTGPESSSLEYRIAQIADECQGENEWETARNLHDWLTHHMYYDYTYNYHGADSIYRGYGVCDSYAKAYVMLCEAAGIEVGRVSSDAMNHTWNLVNVFGDWYQVDVTWDDPGDDMVPVSGQESYDYFCLNNELMYMDHTSSDIRLVTDNGSLDCTSLDANYDIAMDTWSRFGVGLAEDENGTWLIGGSDAHYRDCNILNDFIAAMNDGQTTITLAWQWYNADGGGIYHMGERQYILFTYGLSMRTYDLNDGTRVRATATHEPGTDSITLTVTGEAFSLTYDFDDLGNLIIAGDGSMPDYEAGEAPWYDVQRDAVRTVIIEDIDHIGANAFYGFDALTGVFLESVESIDDDAFPTDLPDSFSLFAPTDSPVAAYADAKGWGFGPWYGSFGDGLSWRFDPHDGWLTISGNGAMPDYDSGTDVPWAALRQNYISCVEFAHGITYIGSNALVSCDQLWRIYISGSVSDIHPDAIWANLALSEFDVFHTNTAFTAVDDILFTKDMTTLFLCPPAYEFSGGEYTVPDGVETIGYYAFGLCSQLQRITLPGSLVTVSNGAFAYCDSLEEIIFPASVTTVGDAALYACSSLQTVGFYLSDRAATMTIGDLFRDEAPAGLVICTYRKTAPDFWCREQDCTRSYYDLRILELPADLTTIESQAFVDLPQADAIRIPAGVASIAPDAFDQDILLLVPEASDWVQWAESNGYDYFTY